MKENNIHIYDPETKEKIEPITLTENAIRHIRHEIKKRTKGVGIHFGVKQSGCSGLRYVIEVIETLPTDGFTFPITDDITVYVDQQSYPYVKGTELDYIKKGLNQIFVFNNPKEKSHCGCGESFSIEGFEDDDNE